MQPWQVLPIYCELKKVGCRIACIIVLLYWPTYSFVTLVCMCVYIRTYISVPKYIEKEFDRLYPKQLILIILGS